MFLDHLAFAKFCKTLMVLHILVHSCSDNRNSSDGNNASLILPVIHFPARESISQVSNISHNQQPTVLNCHNQMFPTPGNWNRRTRRRSIACGKKLADFGSNTTQRHRSDRKRWERLGSKGQIHRKRLEIDQPRCAICEFSSCFPVELPIFGRGTRLPSTFRMVQRSRGFGYDLWLGFREKIQNPSYFCGNK